MYGNPDGIITFMVMLVLANKHGHVDMTAQVISATTSIPLDMIERGLAYLAAPDPKSRTETEEGRRIVLLDERRQWGWQIVNYDKYAKMRSEEERREYLTQWKRDARARARDAAVTQPNAVTGTDREHLSTPVHNVHPSYSYSDADSDTDSSKTESTPPAVAVPANALEGELLPKGRKRASETGTRLPADFALTADMAAVALAEGVSAGREFQRFCDYWRGMPGQRGRKSDWPATWRNWCRKAADGGHSRAPGPQLKSAAQLEQEARARGEDPDELDSERAARLAKQGPQAAPQTAELYSHLLRPMAPRPEYRPDPGAVSVQSTVAGVQGGVRRG